MTTFDLADVRTFTADLEAGLSRCVSARAPRA